MSQKQQGAPPAVKGDRNPHEVSGEETRPVRPREEDTAGGGHRSGSRGAGTFENSDGKTSPGQGPSSRPEPAHAA